MKIYLLSGTNSSTSLEILVSANVPIYAGRYGRYGTASLCRDAKYFCPKKFVKNYLLAKSLVPCQPMEDGGQRMGFVSSHVQSNRLLMWDTLEVFTITLTSLLQKDKDYNMMDLNKSKYFLYVG